MDARRENRLAELDVKRAGPEHCRLLTEIAFESKAYWGYSSDFMASCRNELTVSEAKISDHRYSYFVASDDKNLIGFYALERVSDRTVEMEALFVRPEFIGMGVGGLLFRHALRNAEEKGFEEMLIVSDPNAAAFYRKSGCEQIGERQSESIAGRSLPLLKIRLEASK